MPVLDNDALEAKAIPDRLRLHLRHRTRLRCAICGDAAVSELTREELEALAEEIRPPRAKGARHVEQSMNESKVHIGRPPRLRRVEEWELFCYRKSGMSIKQCASFFRVSVPTANRIIAKFRDYESRVEQVARPFRDMIKSPEEIT